ncbi:MAG: hypothetical protein ALECFALPRED_001591 [Alectoria fallacina]|uniref:Uncharacterized protein n=1 Tax=Alectoria fallacina TaxID=1903189 RepID=A0A8H3FBP4_9LECA|nr:MAG: hypothetical protein ALECFALPRED_001591 [Alectoria fallacina]
MVYVMASMNYGRDETVRQLEELVNGLKDREMHKYRSLGRLGERMKGKEGMDKMRDLKALTEEIAKSLAGQDRAE